jgi:protein ImuA
MAAKLWRGSELGAPLSTVLSSGYTALDAELPGGGWPGHGVIDLLQVQSHVAEWRLLAPAMRQVVAAGKDIVLIGPAMQPHLPGLIPLGLDERRLVWIQADTPVERLWATEQVVKSHAAGLLVAWLPQARAEQIRRLQVCAQGNEGPVFLCRPIAAAQETSAAPLRVQLRFGVDWELQLELLKRRGPAHEGVLHLPSIPSSLQTLITPRLSKPSALIAARQARTATAEASLIQLNQPTQLTQRTQQPPPSPFTPSASPSFTPLSQLPYVVGRPHTRRTASSRAAAH